MRDKCKCGFSLSESEIKACHSVPVLKSQEVFQDLLTGNKNKVTLNTNDISAKEFFELFGHFGYLISGIPSNVLDQSSTIQKIAFSKRLATRDIEMLTLMTRVIYQLIVYPSLHFVNVMAFIDREMKKYQPELYRNRQARLKKIVNHPSGMFYQEQLIRYFENNRSLNDTKRTIVKGQKLNNSYIGIGEAKAITKIDHASVEKLIEINALKTYPTIDGKSFVLKREEVENLLKVKKECIGLNVIIKDLEIRFQNIIRIIDRGKIEVFHGPGKDGYYNWLIEEVNYKKYKDKLFQNTKLVEEVDESWITFSQSVFKVRNWGVSFEDLLELVENGEVTSVLLKNRQSLKGLYILKTDVEHIVKVKQSQIIESNGYATKKLIKVLKMGQPKIERLIDKGVLKVTHQQKNENGTITRFISKDQIIDYLMCSRGWNKKVVEDYLAINSGYR
ncbi:hypothetical protein [Virgibacillus sp. DJP39]|uniref:hypothetical protein n=1 Tax=Virgibacillus sp. DJP39 TaxID=3409790 RepID=UPI003BB5BF51